MHKIMIKNSLQIREATPLRISRLYLLVVWVSFKKSVSVLRFLIIFLFAVTFRKNKSNFL